MVDPNKEYEIFANGHRQFLTASSRKKVMNAELRVADAYNCFDAEISSLAGKKNNATNHVSSQDVKDVKEVVEGSGGASRRKKRIIMSNEDSSASRLLASSYMLPEAVSSDLDMSTNAQSPFGRDGIVTLRVRSLKGKSLPEFSEGDSIIGCCKLQASAKGKKKKRNREKKRMANDFASQSDEEEEDLDEGYDSDGEEEYTDDEDYETDCEEDDDSDSRERKKKPEGGKNKNRRKTNYSCTFKIDSIYWGTASYVNLLLDGSSSRNGGGNNRSQSDRNCFVVCKVLKSF